jgi:hypothetical protein
MKGPYASTVTTEEIPPSDSSIRTDDLHGAGTRVPQECWRGGPAGAADRRAWTVSTPTAWVHAAARRRSRTSLSAMPPAIQLASAPRRSR